MSLLIRALSHTHTAIGMPPPQVEETDPQARTDRIIHQKARACFVTAISCSAVSLASTFIAHTICPNISCHDFFEKLSLKLGQCAACAVLGGFYYRKQLDHRLEELEHAR